MVTASLLPSALLTETVKSYVSLSGALDRGKRTADASCGYVEIEAWKAIRKEGR